MYSENNRRSPALRSTALSHDRTGMRGQEVSVHRRLRGLFEGGKQLLADGPSQSQVLLSQRGEALVHALLRHLLQC